ncbi:16S rRNA (cytosine(967)-C(5))-methyltransferase [hydrothermal vent metagenome]|uniref:16S rRNA (Cytosine(967)-C(5))-methyltransferase n=1 Tax=hydrothermal vent metagenome TaxID=652676 RepID=A0A3B1BYI7_9ZZZZ
METKKVFRLNALLEENTLKLDERDKRFVAELVYGVTRWKRSLDLIIDKLSKTPIQKINAPTLVLLRMGLYQIFEMSKTPLSAAVNETVNLARTHHKARHFAGFINGILRTSIRKTGADKERKNLADAIAPLIDNNSHASLAAGLKSSFPDWIAEKWINQFGLETAQRIMQKSNERAPVFFRLNDLKISPAEFAKNLAEWEMEAEPVNFANGMWHLIKGKITPASEPVLKGFIQPQDVSSFLAANILSVKPGDIVADICCGKGIKSGALASSMQNQGFIFCVDKSGGQLENLVTNMKRLGVSITQPVMADTAKSWPTKKMFNKIMIDAPCSGTGTLRRHPEGKWNKTPELVKDMTKIQRAILQTAVKHLAPNGSLVYSVCSIEPEEGTQIIDSILTNEPTLKRDKIKTSGTENFITPKGDLLILPGNNNMDGFYTALITKTAK